MPTYLVRCTAKPRIVKEDVGEEEWKDVFNMSSLIGIFNARNPASLFYVVDQDLSPFDCEYIKLPTCSGYFFSYNNGDTDIEASLSESLLSYLTPFEKSKNPVWKDFTEEDFIDTFPRDIRDSIKEYRRKMGT